MSDKTPLADGGTPTEYTVDEVNAYLADASQEERDRVLTIERTERDRVGITQGDYAGPVTPEPQVLEGATDDPEDVLAEADEVGPQVLHGSTPEAADEQEDEYIGPAVLSPTA